MNFLYPLGLLGLIGVPILIIIYIIKNKYMEQTIASTYIWTVSERFLKRKRPINKLAGLVSLILQLLAIVFISFAVAHPVLTLPGEAKAYCFVLDASGSMCMQTNGVSRFDEGKQRVAQMIKDSTDGSTFTFICADDAVTVLDTTSDKDVALEQLDGLSASYVTMNVDGALEKAQDIFEKSLSTVIYLVTDTEYESATNVNVINVAGDEINYSITALTVTPTEGGYLAEGVVGAYGATGELNIDLYVDDATQPVASAVVDTTDGTFSFACEGTYSLLRAVIRENDNLADDNEYILYNVEEENAYTALIVSKRPFFLESIIKVLNGETTLESGETVKGSVEVVDPEKYTAASGYDLYVFDGFSPEEMPDDGVVWFFGIKENVAQSGFSVQREMEFTTHDYLEITDSTESVAQQLIADISNKEAIAVTKYVQYGLYRNFTTLYEYKSIPMIFTGINTYGYREVVFSFDLHDSNLTVLYDYPVLMRNLWRYSFPEVVEKTVYYSGEEIQINAIPNCKSIRVDSPLGNASYLEMSNGASIFTPDEVGVYAITLTSGNIQKKYYIYSALPESEREVAQAAGAFDVVGEFDENGLDGIQDILIVAFICLALMFAADWMVYCYDKYQLR